MNLQLKLFLVIILITFSKMSFSQMSTSSSGSKSQSKLRTTMKYLAIEKEIKSVDWSKEGKLLKEEALRVYNLYLDGYLREIYFNEAHNAVIILECASKDEAQKILDSLPLVKGKFIEFDLMELKPYTGLSRLMEN